MITQASLLHSRAAIVTEDSQWGEPVDTALNPVRETCKNDELRSSGPSIGSDLNLNQQETASIDSKENQPTGKKGAGGIRKIMKDYRRSIKSSVTRKKSSDKMLQEKHANDTPVAQSTRSKR